MEYESFNDAIKQAGEETATIINSQGDDCFQFSRDDLAPILMSAMTLSMPCNQLLTYLPPLLSLCTPPSNNYLNRLRTKSSLPKQSRLLISAQRSTTCEQTHMLPGNTFAFSPAEAPVTTKRKS